MDTEARLNAGEPAGRRHHCRWVLSEGEHRVRASLRIPRALLVAALLAAYFCLGLGIATRKSNTYDEAFHITSGYAYLRKGIDYFGAKNHPVLGRALIGLFPAAFLDLDFETTTPPDFTLGTGYHEYAGHFLYENRVPGDRILLLARLSNLLLGALLGLFVYRWANEAWGETGAGVALFLYALSPAILANASLATTDLPIAAFFTVTCYFLQRLTRPGPSGRAVLGAGLFLGLSLAVKYTAVLLLPLLLAAFVMRLRRERTARVVGLFALVPALAYLVIWTAYGWRYHSSGPAFTGFPWEQFSGLAAEPLVRTLRTLHALPESYLYGLLGSLSGAGAGAPAFLMGEYSMTGWRHYFLVAFLIKTPVAALLLLGVALARLARRPADREQALWLLGPALLLAVVVSAQKLNIGIRHILPVYPLLCVLAGAAVPAAARPRRLPRVLLCAGLGWYLWAALAVFPHQLAYFNEIVGGPKNGYRYLVDSNLDWGQDLKGLKQYMDRAGIARVKLAYFGFADPHWFGIDYEYLPSVSILNPVHPGLRPEFSGWFAISATMLQGVYLRPQDRDLYAIFRDLKPVTTIGHSIFVYKL